MLSPNLHVSIFDILFIQPNVELVNVNSRLGLGCVGADAQIVSIGHFNIRWLHVDRLQLYFVSRLVLNFEVTDSTCLGSLAMNSIFVYRYVRWVYSVVYRIMFIHYIWYWFVE